MARPPFLEALAARVLVCDGAMGTMLYARGVFINRCFESLNLSAPDAVADVHRQYVRAGADVIETNTFGANRLKLRAFGLGDQVAAVNRAGARLAREAAGDAAYVAGAIGPLGVRIEPWGKTGVDEARAFFREQVEALHAEGVDLFILETFRDVNEVGAAIDAVREVCDLPIVAQVTTEDDGNSLDGTPPEQFGPLLAARGAQVVGLNCSVGPAPMLETLERLAEAVDTPLSAQPNAGRPRDIEGRNIYLCSPEYMASYARRFIAQSVRLVGGCCGTTPDHIRQISLAVKQLAPGLAHAAREPHARRAPVDLPHARPPIPRERKSHLSQALAAGQFVCGAELVPPRGHEVAAVLDEARQLRDRGVAYVMVSDGHRGGARLGALSLAVLVEQQTGLEALLQYSCRDRNLLGIQSDLLGAHAMGLRNLVGVTGDVRGVGDYPDATAVFDVDSIGLTHLVSRLNHGLDIGGQPIGAPTGFHAGVVVNPGAQDPALEQRRFAFKAEAGAEFAITRPVFDREVMARFLEQAGPVRLPVIAVVRPLDSLLHAEFLANEVPGVSVPALLVDRMRAADAAGHAAEEGLRIAAELATSLRPLVQGIVIAAGPGRLMSAIGILDGLAASGSVAGPTPAAGL